MTKRAPWLFRGFVGDEILPSYMGIMINHYKDLYEPTSRRGFMWLFCWVFEGLLNQHLHLLRWLGRTFPYMRCVSGPEPGGSPSLHLAPMKDANKNLARFMLVRKEREHAMNMDGLWVS